MANELYNRGFRYIGRYLSNVEGGADKALTTAEIQILLTAGLKIFPIFQESEHIPVPTDFTKATGKTDAAKALKAALALGIKQRTTIYFAVDCDMMEDQVMGYALPYFEGIHEVLDNSEYYKVDVYGARNTCIKVRAAYPGTNCFVANMSSGYSGNLGYRMPDNWLFEQYIEKKNYAIAGTSFDLDYDIASNSAEGITAVDINSNLDDYVPPFNPSVDGLMTEKPTIRILDLLPAITWLEERYYDLYDITNPTDAQKRVCSQAVCDFLCQYVYNDLKWKYVAPKNDHFINYINVHYANNPNYVALYPYIYATVNEDGEEPQTIRPQLVKDGHLGLFELPHLAIVIKCYMQSPVPGEWSAWAGDFATGVQETCTMGQTVGFLNLAKDRLGDYEPDVAIPATSRQFNYYDIIADLDGYAIRELIRTIPSLSGCIQEYYSNLARYNKRYQYFKDILGFDQWDVADICVTILDYFYADGNLWLRNLFAPDYDEYSGAVEATATIFAHNIIYWAEYTDVSMT